MPERNPYMNHDETDPECRCEDCVHAGSDLADAEENFDADRY